ncbi:uncharacterized protein LOC115927326 isoform X1 [Strongylocentrotus purpuratus]|uniref:Uncharacterized protein n=4 Tax=Strongylocentrotus purpuratus TaxID=7668 RepID=A0A7M7PDZ7_STRPU|nr:uncharacterized protein LOC115920198 isoform X1 [Strongylocentrotus purpuratus]XP_030833688.1 uncharacterized protein LOC115920984 isoform X1 [Strongylocentrotus purpuratus]XP_030848964.1 uncharacterized protein LOC115927326 isoform X1 [Strongylocentrotus purpuratus]
MLEPEGLKMELDNCCGDSSSEDGFIDPLTKIVQRWGCPSVLKILEENEVDVETLPLLSESIITSFIPKIGPRLKFLAGWRAEYHAANQQSMEQASTSTRSPSVFSLDDCSDLSCVTGSEWSPRQSPSQPSLDTPLYDSPESKSPDQHPPLKRVKKVHFNIACILRETTMGRAALRNINATNLCSKRDRHTVVDMLTQYLIREYGTKPSSFVKASMAHALVTSFPFLKDPESPLGYEAWYCVGAKGRPATGYLEEHLRYVRKKEKSLRVPVAEDEAESQKQGDTDLESVNDDNITTMEEWLRNNKEPEDMVKDYMKQTATKRHDWIKRSDCCVKNILTTYPRLLDAGMIEGDFAELFPEKANALYQKWPTFCNKVVDFTEKTGNWRSARAEFENIHDPGKLSLEEKSNLGFYMLPVLFRGRKDSKRGTYTTAETLSSFIDVQPEVLDIQTYVDNIDEAVRSQPFVVVRGNILTPIQAYVVVERRILPAATLLKAVDLCFKALYVMDIEYQPQSCSVWKFLQIVVFQFTDGEHLTPKLREVRAFMNMP